MSAEAPCYLAGQLVTEAEVLDGLGLSLKRPLDEVLTALRKGGLLLKHGRHGKPKVHFFRLGVGDTALRWRSASGSVKGVRLRNVREVLAGQRTEVFRRYPLREEHLSFSLQYVDEDSSARTLDLTCPDQAQHDVWFAGLKVVVARLQVAGDHSPLAASVAAASSPSFTFYATPTDAVRSMASGGAGAASAGGRLGLPSPDHAPGDLLSWGAAQRGGAAPASVRSGFGGVAEDCWQRSNAPACAAFNSRLDVHRAAVGRKHAAVITATGALYTWGEGKGGKLGLGHDQDRSSPQRLSQGLGGQCVVAVACGDDCTAAITAGGSLYMWGWMPGASASRPLLVPVPVRGGLAGKRVTQVSCGPFHCAAVTSEGQLFTWGEGFGGKLGHGDQICRMHPTFVSALAATRVLEVACGVWHTAAIAVDSLDGLGSALDAAFKCEASTADVPPAGGGGGLEGPLPPTSPLRGVHHARNGSASSAISDASLHHEGPGGVLYTWGGVSESVVFGGEGEGKEKRDSNKGCLGHGYDDLYRGQPLPERVRGALESRPVRHVAAGLHLTVAVTTGGRVFQMGVTGATASKACPWEGAVQPEQVRGALAGLFVDEVACGMHHVVAVARQVERKTGRPQEHGPALVLSWGRGSEGQLGTRGFEDSASPVVVEGLKGRQVLQVSCGGCNTVAVCENDARRFEAENKEEAEAAARVLSNMGDGRPPAPPSARSSLQGSLLGEMVRRSFSAAAPAGAAAAGAGTGGNGSVHGNGVAASLARISGGSLRSNSGKSRGDGLAQPPAAVVSQLFASMQMAQRQPQRSSSIMRRASGLQLRPHTSTERPVLAGGGSDAGSVHGGGSGKLVSVSPVQQAQPSGLPPGPAALAARRSLLTSRSFTAHSHLSASEMSSISSMPRPLSDDGAYGEAESHSGGVNGGVVSSADLAAIDEIRSSSSVATMHEELDSKNRLIERLESKLAKMQRQASRASTSGDTDERLREAVRSSAGHFREALAQQAAAAAAAGGSAALRRAMSRQTSPMKPGGPPVLGRSSLAFSEAGTSASRLEEQEASLRAMEAALARKQHELQKWAEELQQQEVELARRQAGLQSQRQSPDPQPLRSSSPVLPPSRAAAQSPSPQVLRSLMASEAGMPPFVMGTPKPSRGDSGPSGRAQQQATPASAKSAGSSAAGAAPASASGKEEWTEEFEEGVFLTFTADAEGMGKRLKRIRFSRTRFNKEAASQWYELNKHRLAAPTGAPSGPRPISQPSPSAAERSLASADVHGPAAGRDAAANGRPAATAEEPAAAPEPAGPDAAEGEDAISLVTATSTSSAGQLLASLHYRQTSRNLSFDVRDLADFHEQLHRQGMSVERRLPQSRLAQAGPPAAVATAEPGLQQQHHQEPVQEEPAVAGAPEATAQAQGGLQAEALAAGAHHHESPRARPEEVQLWQSGSSASPFHTARDEPSQLISDDSGNLPHITGDGQGWQSAASSPMSQRSPRSLRSRPLSGLSPDLDTPASSNANSSGPTSPIRALPGSRSGSPGKQAATAGLSKQPSRELSARGPLSHSVKSESSRLSQQSQPQAHFSPRFAQRPATFPAAVGSEGEAAASPASSGASGSRLASSPKGPSGGLSGTVSRLKRAMTGGSRQKK